MMILNMENPKYTMLIGIQPTDTLVPEIPTGLKALGMTSFFVSAYLSNYNLPHIIGGSHGI